MSENEIVNLGFKEIKTINYAKNETIANGHLTKQLGKGRQCELINKNKNTSVCSDFINDKECITQFKCSDLLILSETNQNKNNRF